MKKIVGAFLFCLVGANTFAQNSFWSNPDYGLTFSLNHPIIKPVSKDTLSMKTEWGTSIFFEFGKNERMRLQTSLGYDRVRYNHNEFLRTVTQNNVNLGFTGFYQPTGFNGTRFFLGIEPSYTLTELNALDPNKPTLILKSSELENAFDIGFRIGMSLELKPHIALNLAYKEMLYGSPVVNRYNGTPDQFEIGFQIKFNRIKTPEGPSKREVALSHIGRLKDSSVLVFVINTHSVELKGIEDELDRTEFIEKVKVQRENQLAALDSLFKFCEYVVISENDLSSFIAGDRKQQFLLTSAGFQTQTLNQKGIYYARIGEFLIDDNQSTRSGVFIYDDQMSLVQNPFPGYTPYFGLESFLSDEKRLAAMFMSLNERLDLMYWSRD